MFTIFTIVFLLAIGNCQLLREEERPTRYVLPYSGLNAEEPELEDKHYYKPNRRAERIPATAYQYDEAEEEYYRPQPPPQPRQKVETESYQSRYQPTTPSHKDYEEILKHNHLARLRVAAKKQTQTPASTPQQPVEQYLKEVNPTTKTAFQRPTNYLRFSGQSALKQEQNEETPLKQQPYRYVLQSEAQQQKPYSQYQFETQQESTKPAPKTPHFNLVAYQNALIAQQKLLAAENQDEASKSSIYVSQNIKKTKKPKTSGRQSSTHYDYYPQVPPQRPTYTPESGSSRYQQPLTPRNYPKNENFQVEDSLLYPEQKEIEYQTQPPVRANKQRTTRPPRRKPKYQTEPKYQPEPKYQAEPKYPTEPKYQTEEPQEDFNAKYQSDDQYEYQPAPAPVKYQEEPTYRRPLPPRPTKASKYEPKYEPKYEDQADKEEYLYNPAPKYQSRRQPPQYGPEAEVRPSRYLGRQYQEESKQLPQYQAADLAYQPTAEVAVRQPGRGPSVSYRQTYPQYQYDNRQQFITPKTRHIHSVEYPNALEQEEEPTVYITNKPLHHKTQKIYPSTQYKYHTANTIKLAPVYQAEKGTYEVEEHAEDVEPEEFIAVYNYTPAPVSKHVGVPKRRNANYSTQPPRARYEEVTEVPVSQFRSNFKYEEPSNASDSKFRPENVIKKKGLHYPRRQKKRPTYLNGQSFREEVKRPRKYQLQDLVTQSSSPSEVRYDASQPFLILVYDE